MCLKGHCLVVQLMHTTLLSNNFPAPSVLMVLISPELLCFASAKGKVRTCSNTSNSSTHPLTYHSPTLVATQGATHFQYDNSTPQRQTLGP